MCMGMQQLQRATLNKPRTSQVINQQQQKKQHSENFLLLLMYKNKIAIYL